MKGEGGPSRKRKGTRESRFFLKRHESRRGIIWEEERDQQEEIGGIMGVNVSKIHYIHV
jgi:hypothetical protein